MSEPLTQAIVPPRTQKVCCYTSAIEDDATYCEDCGKPLMRCMAAEECGGLLDDHGLCTVCVSPHLQVDAGAMVAARVGGAVSLPLSIANLSVVGRPLFVTSVWTKEAGGDWREQSLGWERLAAGEVGPVSIIADKFDRAGAHSIKVLVALASRWRWREERFAFEATLRLNIEADKSGNGPVVNLGKESAGHGNVVYISGQDKNQNEVSTAKEAITLAMVRAELEERSRGLRGIDKNLWVPKSTQFQWRSFDAQSAPHDGPLLNADGMLAFGRSRTKNSGGPNDVRLLVQGTDGKVDEDMSRLISRRHFELYVECDRLMLRVESEAGVRVNGDAYGRGKTVCLNDGDRISPLVKHPDLLALKVDFQIEHGAVRTVTVTRQPKTA